MDDIVLYGPKMKAENSIGCSYSRKRLKRTMDDFDRRIKKYLHEMDENDAA